MLLFFLPSGHGLASGVAKRTGPQRRGQGPRSVEQGVMRREHL